MADLKFPGGLMRTNEGSFTPVAIVMVAIVMVAIVRVVRSEG